MNLRCCWALSIACGCGGTATEEHPRPQLTVAISSYAGSTGSVIATSGGSALFECRTETCTAPVANGAVVTLTAASGESTSLFTGWSGDCTGSGPSCTITMNTAMTAAARFRPRANIVFTTSTRLAMPFGATAKAAQAAADGFCNSRARDAHLPGHYAAWLSTSTTSAISKLGGASGWMRADGRPFAASQADLRAGRILYPLVIGERANDLGTTFDFVATGTDADGSVLAGGTCNDWTSTSGTTAGTGVMSGGSRAWTAAPYDVPCAGPFALYCFETSFDVPVVAAATGRIAFVSKRPFAPGFGKSRADADAICQSEAQAAGLPAPFSDYLALLATTAESAIGRFSTDASLPTWVRPDGVLVVEKARHILGTWRILAPIDVTADKTYVPGGITWTGSLATDLTGDLASTCNDWGSTANSGHGGQIEYTFHWFDEYRNSITCLGAEPVYCFQK